MRWWWVLMLVWCTMLPAEVAVVHPTNPEGELSPERLRDILLGRITTWSSGAPIVIVLSEETAANAAQRRITDRDLAQLLRGWKRLVYGGNGAMPLVRRTTEEALMEVRRRTGAVTVVPTSTDTTGLLRLYHEP